MKITSGRSFGQFAIVLDSHWIWSRPTPAHAPATLPSRVAMWPIRSLGVIFLAVQ